MKIKMFLSDKNKLTIQKGTDFLLVSAIIIFFVFLFWGINIINSGYHIIDDHEIYYFPSVINKDTVIQYFNDFILNDGRFRPLYWIHRVLLFYIFKQNFTLYYTEMFVLGIISSLCLFFALKNISKNSIISFLLIAFLFLGETLSIFEGLGYGELFGLTLLSATLFLLTVKNNKFCEILSLIFLILCMFSKEQFLLSFPFVILFKIFLDDNNILKSLKQNTVYILISAIFLLLYLPVIYISSEKIIPLLILLI